MNSQLIMVPVFFLVWLVWEYRLFYPIRLVTTFFHEVGHAIATVVTGGRVEDIRIHRYGGVILRTGGNDFLVCNAGYLGSVLIGSLFFYLTYTRFQGVALVLMGLLMVLFVLLWVKNKATMIPCLIIAGILIAAGVMLPGLAKLIIARFVGLCSVLYSFVVLKNYTRYCSSDPGTDAKKLGKETNTPPTVWAVAWCLISVCVLFALGQLMVTGKLPGQ